MLLIIAILSGARVKSESTDMNNDSRSHEESKPNNTKQESSLDLDSFEKICNELNKTITDSLSKIKTDLDNINVEELERKYESFENKSNSIKDDLNDLDFSDFDFIESGDYEYTVSLFVILIILLISLSMFILVGTVYIQRKTNVVFYSMNENVNVET
jgi:hypothetical protein